MLVNDEKHRVITNSQGEHKFSINMNAKSFEIFSSGIYKYKIAAIVRELCCNAYDSHVSAGKEDLPIEVTIPNTLHPYFEVEDYGVGMNDEEIKNIFTRVFETTKDKDPNSIGAFGVGSKSPITYTDAYNIRTRKDGTEWVYTCYRDEDKIPVVNLLSQEATTEPNGVKISVPVNQIDFSTFKQDAEFILSMFKTRPNVNLRGFEFVFDEDKIRKFYEKGYMTELHHKVFKSQLYNNNKYNIVMGGVCYPVSAVDVEMLLDTQDIALMTGLNISLYVNVEIGAIKLSEISVSRESLSYNVGTQEKVAKFFSNALKSLRSDIENRINESDSEFDAVVSTFDYYGTQAQGILPMFCYKDRENNLYSYAIKQHILKRHNISFYQHSPPSMWFSTKKVHTSGYVNLFMLSKINPVKLVVIVTRNSNVGLIKYCKDITDNSYALRIPNSTIKAVKKYFAKLKLDQYLDIEYVDYDEHRKEVLAEAALKRKKTISTKSAKPKTPDNIISTYHFNLNKCQRDHCELDLESADHVYHFVKFEDCEYYIPDLFLKTTKYYGKHKAIARSDDTPLAAVDFDFRLSMVTDDETILDKTHIVIPYNKHTERKIKKYEIQSLDVFINKLKNDFKQQFENDYDDNIAIITNVPNSYVVLYSINDWFKNAFEKYARLYSSIDQDKTIVLSQNFEHDTREYEIKRSFIRLTQIEINTNIESHRVSYNTLADFEKSVTKRYPLIFNVEAYEWSSNCKNEVWLNHLRKYIEMVDYELNCVVKSKEAA